MSENKVSRIVPADIPFPGYHKVAGFYPPWHENDEYFVLQGDSLKDALEGTSGQNLLDAVKCFQPLSYGHNHIQISDVSALQGCGEAFFDTCKELRIRIAWFVDEETFYDYAAGEYCHLAYEYGWHALDDEACDGEWWTLRYLPFDKGEQRRKAAQQRTGKVLPSPRAAISSLMQEAPARQAALDAARQIELLTKLKALLDAGVLTQAEFQQKKKQILGE